MYQLKLEPQFKKDYQRLKYRHSELIDDLMNTLNQLHFNGIVNDEYRPHILDNRGGKVDVLVIYMPHKTNPSIRLIRVGSHNELFHSKLK